MFNSRGQDMHSYITVRNFNPNSILSLIFVLRKTILFLETLVT